MVGIYGAGVLPALGPVDYETFVGLWMNRDRTEIRQSSRMLIALRAALPGVGVSKKWFDAVCEDAGQADAEFNRFQAMKSGM